MTRFSVVILDFSRGVERKVASRVYLPLDGISWECKSLTCWRSWLSHHKEVFYGTVIVMKRISKSQGIRQSNIPLFLHISTEMAYSLFLMILYCYIDSSQLFTLLAKIVKQRTLTLNFTIILRYWQLSIIHCITRNNSAKNTPLILRLYCDINSCQLSTVVLEIIQPRTLTLNFTELSNTSLHVRERHNVCGICLWHWLNMRHTRRCRKRGVHTSPMAPGRPLPFRLSMQKDLQ